MTSRRHIWDFTIGFLILALTIAKISIGDEHREFAPNEEPSSSESGVTSGGVLRLGGPSRGVSRSSSPSRGVASVSTRSTGPTGAYKSPVATRGFTGRGADGKVPAKPVFKPSTITIGTGNSTAKGSEVTVPDRTTVRTNATAAIIAIKPIAETRTDTWSGITIPAIKSDGFTVPPVIKANLPSSLQAVVPDKIGAFTLTDKPTVVIGAQPYTTTGTTLDTATLRTNLTAFLASAEGTADQRAAAARQLAGLADPATGAYISDFVDATHKGFGSLVADANSDALKKPDAAFKKDAYDAAVAARSAEYLATRDAIGSARGAQEDLDRLKAAAAKGPKEYEREETRMMVGEWGQKSAAQQQDRLKALSDKQIAGTITADEQRQLSFYGNPNNPALRADDARRAAWGQAFDEHLKTKAPITPENYARINGGVTPNGSTNFVNNTLAPGGNAERGVAYARTLGTTDPATGKTTLYMKDGNGTLKKVELPKEQEQAEKALRLALGNKESTFVHPKDVKTEPGKPPVVTDNEKFKAAAEWDKKLAEADGALDKAKAELAAATKAREAAQPQDTNPGSAQNSGDGPKKYQDADKAEKDAEAAVKKLAEVRTALNSDKENPFAPPPPKPPVKVADATAPM